MRSDKLWTPSQKLATPSKELLLPTERPRASRLIRPDSRDYREVSAMEPTESLSYDAFITEMKEQWEGQFTPAERSGPIKFKGYLEDSLKTLKWRRDVEIPNSVKKGTLTKAEGQTSVDFMKMLISYTERALKGM